MKGANLHVLILTITGLVMAIIMVSLNIYPSWSQYARSLEEPLLFATLTSFSTMFMIRSFTFGNGGMVLAQIFGMDYRLSHNNRITAYLFIMILVTPVTHPSPFIEIAHFIFTGSAIGFAYWELLNYYPKKTAQHRGNLLGVFVGVLGFLGGFILKIYSIGLGELIASIPIAIHILSTLKNKYYVPR